MEKNDIDRSRGWVAIWRKVTESPLYVSLNSKQRDIFLQLLLHANHKENEWFYGGKAYKVIAGQLITSLPSIKSWCAKDVSTQNIRTCLLILEKGQFLTSKSTNKNRLITICKWKEYQTKLTGKLTGDQQATNRQLTANNNDKNDNNVNNKSITTVIHSYYFEKTKRKERLTLHRKRLIESRLKTYSVKEIKQAIDNVANPNSFYGGGGERNWVAGLDFIFKNDENIDKILNEKIISNVAKI